MALSPVTLLRAFENTVLIQSKGHLANEKELNNLAATSKNLRSLAASLRSGTLRADPAAIADQLVRVEKGLEAVVRRRQAEEAAGRHDRVRRGQAHGRRNVP